ncbi:FAD-dependent monooxygenase [Streptomyces netropsis]|uniref:2-polyprenyl-6-methoxyphenol hydroxylase-like FAD-dependent oxidoreductase n=1 Tax=Streptomyces netropsis TaxID=55404 RepID=A0A7W7L9R0_STRNE|nr:FAD-dependent monooxygenase [Streptomyces netropsis]MBB4885706.1 2-polyprenyl-6-methoxyphenol hydroxylase-like FAD-dependent oxidoreductase [Streptomyces netropsis]GGR36674.1 FAD-dependent oxidoreductase [Streptomyces netropsis]
MNILVSGAGVAGPALAYWLRRHGFTPTVVERAEQVREGGYAVDFRGEALDVLDRMGLLEEIRALDTEMGDAALMGADGQQYATLPAVIFAGDLEVLKGDVTRLLYEATRDDVEYVFGDSIATLEQDDTGVHVTFERGEPRTFELAVGADGLHSRTRALAFGPEEQFVRHLGIYTAIFSLDNYLGLRNTGHLYSVPGRAANIFSARNNTEARAALHFASEPLEYDWRDVEEHRRIVAERFADEGWQVPRLLREAAKASDFHFDANAQVKMDRWSTGRVVLLGDAGYCAAPTSGRGTSQALIGAYVLAGELAAAGGEHTAAFEAYEREMRGYVTEHQQAGREGAERFFMGTPTQEMLDMIAANAPEVSRTQVARLKTYRPAA